MSERETVLTFVVGARTRLGVGLRWVTEVADVAKLTPLPRAPNHISGIAQVNGRPVPVLDLARFLALSGVEVAPGSDDEAERFILIHTDTMEVALLGRSVRVEAIESLASDDMAFGPQLRSHARGQARTSRGPAVLLDIPSVLDAARVRH